MCHRVQFTQVYSIYRRQEVILKRNIAVSQVDVCLSLVACLFEEQNIYSLYLARYFMQIREELLSVFFYMNINQMKRAIHIRCTQQFLYFESHIKSLKQLHIMVCFSVLTISSAFTISTYFINECMYLDENSRKEQYWIHV